MIGTKGKLWHKDWGNENEWYHIEIIDVGSEPNSWKISYQKYYGRVKTRSAGECDYEQNDLDKYFIPYTKLEKALL